LISKIVNKEKVILLKSIINTIFYHGLVTNAWF